MAELAIENPEIFAVHALGSLVAMVAEESVMDVFVGGIEVIQHYIGVAGMGGGKDDDLEMFGEVFDNLLGMGADVDAGFDDLAGGEGYGQFYVVGRGEGIVAVDQSLVKIKNN